MPNQPSCNHEGDKRARRKGRKNKQEAEEKIEDVCQMEATTNHELERQQKQVREAEEKSPRSRRNLEKGKARIEEIHRHGSVL